MTKKRSTTCYLIAVLVLISAFIYRVGGSKNLKTSASLNKSSKAMPQNSTPDLSFCNEALPVNDASVTSKLQHSLQKHDYKTIQSNILQTKAIKLFPIIEPILKAYGIPDDFKYMPLVESGLNSGTSPKGAKGVWQLMPGTARIL